MKKLIFLVSIGGSNQPWPAKWINKYNNNYFKKGLYMSIVKSKKAVRKVSEHDGKAIIRHIRVFDSINLNQEHVHQARELSKDKEYLARNGGKISLNFTPNYRYVGTLVGVMHNGKVLIGWSKVHANDLAGKLDSSLVRNKGYKVALDRAKNGKVVKKKRIPAVIEKAMPEFVERASKYFKKSINKIKIT